MGMLGSEAYNNGNLGVSFKLAATEQQVAKERTSAPTVNEAKNSQLPKYTKDDVARHSTKSTGIWVTHKDGVYDITSFVEVHPGKRYERVYVW